MAGEKETKKFFDAIEHPDKYETGVISRSGGKKRAIRYGGYSKENVNRDRTELLSNGKVKRYVWTTAIATYDPKDNEITFRDGGWHSKLTKERLNQVLRKGGTSLSQKDFNWYLDGEDWISGISLDAEKFGIKRKGHQKTNKVS